MLEDKIQEIRDILYEEMTFKSDADELLKPIVEALKEKEKQDSIYNLLKEIIRFNVLQPEVKETDNGFSLATKVVLEVRRNIENQERQQLRNWILNECFPKEMKVLELIREIRKSISYSGQTICMLPNGKTIECDMGYVEEFFEMIENEYDLIKEEIVCQ